MWQGMAAAIPILETSTTIYLSLPYQYFRDLLGPATPIFEVFRHPCSVTDARTGRRAEMVIEITLTLFRLSLLLDFFVFSHLGI